MSYSKAKRSLSCLFIERPKKQIGFLWNYYRIFIVFLIALSKRMGVDTKRIETTYWSSFYGEGSYKTKHNIIEVPKPMIYWALENSFNAHSTHLRTFEEIGENGYPRVKSSQRIRTSWFFLVYTANQRAFRSRENILISSDSTSLVHRRFIYPPRP